MFRRFINRIESALHQRIHRDAAATAKEVKKLRDEQQTLKFLQGTQAALLVSQMDKLPTLGAAGFRVTSQWGEDGIIEWLVGKLPMLKPSFVEFGVESYTEANTLFLLQRHNWRGLVADIGRDAVATIDSSDLKWRYDITAVQMKITRDNINSLFLNNGFAGEIGILSIDIDGNDYWVWDAISVSNPGVVICEYNGIFGDMHALSVPPDDNFYRTEKHFSNLYWGASVGAMQHMATSRGYTFVGTNVEGCNAFFVRNDIAHHVLDRIADKRARAPLYRESRDEAGRLTYLSGTDRLSAISSMPIVNVVTGENATLEKYAGSLYSEHWQSAMGAS